jgi:trk system potassium uptake protein TrkH
MSTQSAESPQVLRARGLAFVGAAPILFLVGDAFPSTGGAWEPPGRGAAACTVALGGLVMPRSPRVGSTLVTLGLVGAIAAHAPAFFYRPDALVLALGSATLAALAGLGPTSGKPSAASAWPPLLHSLAASGITGWFTVVALERTSAPEIGLAVATMAAASLGLLGWATSQGWRRALAATAFLALAAIGSGAANGLPAVVNAMLVVPIGIFLLVPGNEGSWMRALALAVLSRPPRMVVVTFLGLCTAGTLLLALPGASETGMPIPLLDAAFTSVSAVCVTGLVTLDPASTFSGLGEAILIVLIQVGGVGIMTFYTAALAVLGRRLGMKEESAIASSLNVREQQELRSALGRILGLTVGAEATGAALLTGSFVAHGDPLGTALWRGTFTAVSAFCNAGFALQPDSLVAYQTSPVVLHTVAALVAAGGLSPTAAFAIGPLLRRRPAPLQARLVLWTTSLLTLVGAALYLVLEWDASLSGLGVIDRLHNAWFQSVTLRTAGFNSVDLTETRAATQTLMVVWMFIGGSPGGTAGGAKVTTVALLALMVVAAMRGRAHVQVFGRRVSHRTIYRAAAVGTAGLVSAGGVLLLLQLTQALPLEVAVFEAVSALGTVGLTLGGTPRLDEIGKVIVMGAMFSGRVGPLTLFLFLAEQHDEQAWRYPEEEVDVG